MVTQPLSLGSLVQCMTTLLAKLFFLIHNWNTPGTTWDHFKACYLWVGNISDTFGPKILFSPLALFLWLDTTTLNKGIFCRPLQRAKTQCGISKVENTSSIEMTKKCNIFSVFLFVNRYFLKLITHPNTEFLWKKTHRDFLWFFVSIYSGKSLSTSTIHSLKWL